MAVPSEKDLLAMEPIQLMEIFIGEVSFPELTSLDSEASYSVATDILNRATAYICYFKRMETMARIQKREAKAQRKDTAEVNRCLGIEEVFETFKRISETKLDFVSKMFTAKRLVIEEYKRQGHTI